MNMHEGFNFDNEIQCRDKSSTGRLDKDYDTTTIFRPKPAVGSVRHVAFSFQLCTCN
jgi:hypothetical protein